MTIVPRDRRFCRILWVCSQPKETQLFVVGFHAFFDGITCCGTRVFGGASEAIV